MKLRIPLLQETDIYSSIVEEGNTGHDPLERMNKLS